MKAFENNIAAHIAVYGPDNHLRLTGLHETQAIDKFSYGLSDRGASIRMPIKYSVPGKPVVLVLANGSALAVNWANQHVNAILDSWYAGEEGGAAVAETLSGKNNPAGRLPVTFYTGLDQLPAFEDYAMQNRTYRYFSGKPLYPVWLWPELHNFLVLRLALPRRQSSGRPAYGGSDRNRIPASSGR